MNRKYPEKKNSLLRELVTKDSIFELTLLHTLKLCEIYNYKYELNQFKFILIKNIFYNYNDNYKLYENLF